MKYKLLTGDVAVLVLDLEGGQRGEDEAERGDHHEQARHDGDNLRTRVIMSSFGFVSMRIIQNFEGI